MQLQTNFDIEPSAVKIELHSKLVSLGSCFAENMGSRLLNHKLNVAINPFGTVFSPASLFQNISLALDNQCFDERHIVERESAFVHLDTHATLFSAEKETLASRLQQKLVELNENLKTADFLILTLGTAWVYQFLETGKLIANCQKLPASNFKKELIHVKYICQTFASVYQKLKSVNPNLTIVLTVSPVRHIKDGMADNQVSKSILRAACHYLVSDFKEVQYFPAYEIMMDELRDYRFYTDDLIHPNTQAQDYIFERFAKTYFSDSLQKFVGDWQKIKRELAHRPFNPKSTEHQNFLQNLKLKLQKLSSIIDVTVEIQQVENQITN